MRGVKAVSLMALAIALLACMLCLQACGASGDSREAARFGDHVITEGEVNAYTQAYRAKNGLESDESWKAYLSSSVQTPETWRQEAIRKLADRILINDKAAELGITVDSDAVAAELARRKDEAGIAQDDAGAWKDYLQNKGQTPEQLLEDLEFSNVEQQVFKAELNFDDALRDEMCDDYIKANLADQVVCRYAAIAAPLDDLPAAQACLKELEGLEGEELAKRFDELLAQAAIDVQEPESGDLGWDFLYDEARIDPDLALRKATLEKGELYDGVLEGKDALRVVLCTDRASFARTPTFESLESESLKSTIEDLTMVSSWVAKCMKYLGTLEEEAHIQISQMPDNLSYDIASEASSS